MRSLVSYLNERPPQDLRIISELWQVNLTDRLYSGNAYQLSQEMQSEFLQRRIVENLTRQERECLRWFLNQSEFTANLAELSESLSVNYDELKRQAMALRKAGLLFDERILSQVLGWQPPEDPTSTRRSGWGDLYRHRANNIPTVQARLLMVVPRELARPLGRLLNEIEEASINELPTIALSRLPLINLLNRLEPEMLEIQAQTWGILALLGNVTEPAVLANELARALTDTTVQQRVTSDLSSESLKLFGNLKKATGGRTTLKTLLEDYVSVKRLGRALRPLTEQLLVWELFEGGESLVFIPAEILQPQTTSALATPLPLQTVTPPVNTTLYPPYAMAWDALTFLNYISQNVVELTVKHYIPKRDLKRLVSQLWVTEDLDEVQRTAFIINSVFFKKLYRNDLDLNRLQLTEDLHEWLQLDLYEQLRQLVDYWLRDGGRIGPVTYPYYYATLPLVTKANNAMLGWLAECETGIWYSLDALIRRVQHDDPYFILSRRELLNMLGPNRLTETSKQWMRIEGEIIRQTFNTALEWFGIVQVGRDEDERVTAFNLTPFGAEICGKSEATRQFIPPVEKPLLVQPNFEVMLFVPQSATVWMLQKFTASKKLDQVSLYNLNREALMRGLENGLSLKEITEWLAANNQQPLAQNLVISLQDWSKNFRRVTVGPATLLEVEDPAILDELIANKQYSEYFERRLSPNAALVRLPTTSENRRTNPLKSFKGKLKAGGFFSD